MKTKTPLTDEAEWTAGCGNDDRTVVWSDFARELELRASNVAAPKTAISSKEIVTALLGLRALIACLEEPAIGDEACIDAYHNIDEAIRKLTPQAH